MISTTSQSLESSSIRKEIGCQRQSLAMIFTRSSSCLSKVYRKSFENREEKENSKFPVSKKNQAWCASFNNSSNICNLLKVSSPKGQWLNSYSALKSHLKRHENSSNFMNNKKLIFYTGKNRQMQSLPSPYHHSAEWQNSAILLLQNSV